MIAAGVWLIGCAAVIVALHYLDPKRRRGR